MRDPSGLFSFTLMIGGFVGLAYASARFLIRSLHRQPVEDAMDRVAQDDWGACSSKCCRGVHAPLSAETEECSQRETTRTFPPRRA